MTAQPQQTGFASSAYPTIQPRPQMGSGQPGQYSGQGPPPGPVYTKPTQNPAGPVYTQPIQASGPVYTTPQAPTQQMGAMQLEPGKQVQAPPPTRGQQAAPPEQRLPSGWEARMDHSTGALYYVDHNTQTTHWELPSGYSSGVGQSEGKEDGPPSAPSAPPSSGSVPSRPPGNMYAVPSGQNYAAPRGPPGQQPPPMSATQPIVQPNYTGFKTFTQMTMGLTFALQGHYFKVTRVTPNAQAARLGVRVGNIIEAIFDGNHVFVTGLTAEGLGAKLRSAPRPLRIKFSTAAPLAPPQQRRYRPSQSRSNSNAVTAGLVGAAAGLVIGSALLGPGHRHHHHRHGWRHHHRRW